MNAEAVEVGASWTLEHKGLIADGFVGGATCTVTGGKSLVPPTNLLTHHAGLVKTPLLVYEGFIIP